MKQFKTVDCKKGGKKESDERFGQDGQTYKRGNDPWETGRNDVLSCKSFQSFRRYYFARATPKPQGP